MALLSRFLKIGEQIIWESSEISLFLLIKSLFRSVNGSIKPKQRKTTVTVRTYYYSAWGVKVNQEKSGVWTTSKMNF